MVRVILDTNFLLLPYQYTIDIFTQIQHIVDGKAEFCIIDKTKDELAKLMHLGTLKERMAARLGNTFVAEFAKMKKMHVIRTFFARSVDDALMRRATKHDYVATMDKALKEALKDKGVKVITLRGHHCVVEHK